MARAEATQAATGGAMSPRRRSRAATLEAWLGTLVEIPAALLVVALTERPDLLMAATEDALHQRQRAPAMAASAEYLQLLRRHNVAATLSGAGPSLIALTTERELPGEVAEYGAAKGFTIAAMTAGEGVRWSPGVTVPG